MTTDATERRGVNYHVLRVFGPLLILAGVAGFVVPAEASLTSGAAPYNVFHIAFGLIAVALIVRGDERWIRRFNIGFGVIDLYQAVASLFDLFPESYFRWKLADDVLHVTIGLALVTVGLGWRQPRFQNGTIPPVSDGGEPSPGVGRSVQGRGSGSD